MNAYTRSLSQWSHLREADVAEEPVVENVERDPRYASDGQARDEDLQRQQGLS